MSATVQKLRIAAQAALDAYRAASHEPVTLKLDDQHHVEIPPFDEPVSVYVSRKDGGSVRAQFNDDVVIASIYSEDELDPVEECTALASDLETAQ